MERLHRGIWGEKVQADVRHDFSHMTEAGRLRKVHELIELVEEINRRSNEVV